MIAEFPNKFNVSNGPSMTDLLTTPESLSGILNILIKQAMLYYHKGLYESPIMIAAKEEYISGLTKVVKSILESYYASEQSSYILHSTLESEINQILYPNIKLKQGQLKEIMNRLGYKSIRLKSGNDRDKMVYLNLKRK